MTLLSDLETMSREPQQAKDRLSKFENNTLLCWELHSSLPHWVNCGIYDGALYSRDRLRIRDSQASSNYLATISIRYINPYIENKLRYGDIIVLLIYYQIYRKMVRGHSGDSIFLPGPVNGVSLNLPQEFHSFFSFLRRSFVKFLSVLKDTDKKLPNSVETNDLRWWR